MKSWNLRRKPSCWCAGRSQCLPWAAHRARAHELVPVWWKSNEAEAKGQEIGWQDQSVAWPPGPADGLTADRCICWSKARGMKGGRAELSPQGAVFAAMWWQSKPRSRGEPDWRGQLGKCEELNCLLLFGLSVSTQAGRCVDFFVNKLNSTKERPYCKNQFPLPAE